MLSPEQRQEYWTEGFLFPVDVAPTDEVTSWHDELTRLGETHAEAWKNDEVDDLRQWLEPIVTRNSIIDKIGCLIGPKLQVQNVDVFVKDPSVRSILPWKRGRPRQIKPHVDTHFAPPEPDRRITIWIPLAEAKPVHGGLMYYPRSHVALPADLNLSPNRVTIDPGDFKALPDTKGVPVLLTPGQMAIHHGRMVHSSGANYGPSPRIALAIRYQALGEPVPASGPAPETIQLESREFPVTWRPC